MTSARLFSTLLIIGAVLGLGWFFFSQPGTHEQGASSGRPDTRPVPVVTASIETGAIAQQRAFSGTLEAQAEFVAAPKVSGIVEQLPVDLGDRITRGQRVAKLDDAEFVQAVNQAEAELAVAKANLAEANSQLEIAERELRRVQQLRASGATSAAQIDVAQANQLAKQAYVQVTLAQLTRAEAQLETARIRLGYTEVLAEWHSPDGDRVVAERYVDEGETVAVNAPLLKIVRLDPITAVIFVTEKEYAGLQPGQPVSLVTDAYPEQNFTGSVARIAPVFREATRQARVEIEVKNPEQLLKPGMFVRARVVLATEDQATIIPQQALTRRDAQDGVFVVSADGDSVTWRPVQAGIRQGERVAVRGEGLQGEVVVLGQQMLRDGAAIIVSQDDATP